MKKVAVVFLTIILALSVCSCGGNSNIKQAEATTGKPRGAAATETMSAATVKSTTALTATHESKSVFAESTAKKSVAATISTTYGAIPEGITTIVPNYVFGYYYPTKGISKQQYIKQVKDNFIANNKDYLDFVKYAKDKYWNRQSSFTISFDGSKYIYSSDYENERVKKEINDSKVKEFVTNNKISCLNYLYSAENPKQSHFWISSLSDMRLGVILQYAEYPDEVTGVGEKIFSENWKYFDVAW